MTEHIKPPTIGGLDGFETWDRTVGAPEHKEFKVAFVSVRAGVLLLAGLRPFLVYADTASKHGGFPRKGTLGYSNTAGCRSLRRAVADSPGLLMEGGIKRCSERVTRVGCSG